MPIEDNMKIITLGLDNWIVKEEDGHYFHRPEGEYREWRPGIPPGTIDSEVDWAFRQ